MLKNIQLIQGDITQQRCDAIVNAANTSLMGGGGVDGAIHRAGGPDILAVCKQIVAKQGRCPTGQAVITTAGNLPAKWVIHTVGPVWHGGKQNEHKLLRNAYENSCRIARDNMVKTLAFPSISTGAYRFPIEQAAPLALKTVGDFQESYAFDQVIFALFSDEDLKAYLAALKQLLQETN